MKVIKVPLTNLHKACDELPRHCWILVAWNFEDMSFQEWFNEVTEEDLRIVYEH